MAEIILFIKSHAGELFSIFTSLVAVASAIANLTPSDADNKVVAFISKVINYLALNFKK